MGGWCRETDRQTDSVRIWSREETETVQGHNELCLCAVLLGLLTTDNEVTVSGGDLLALIKLAVISTAGKRMHCL